MIKFPLEDGAPPYLIAEIGKNFIQSEEEESVETYLKNACALVDAAVQAGADAVKFQTHNVADEQANISVVSPHFTGSDRYSWVRRNTERTPIDTFWIPLVAHCKARGITFFSTPMSRGAAEKVAQLDPPFWKVGSGDVNDHLLLRYLLDQSKAIIISTGMVGYNELDAAIAYMAEHGHAPAILYCISKYPAPPEYFNLSSIEVFAQRYPENLIGFSDHSIGHEVAFAAAKLGARIIEKHFTFSRDLWGSDHKTSMTPAEFGVMSAGIRSGLYRDIDTSPWYGNSERELDGATNEFRPYFEKTLVAARDLHRGEQITLTDVMALRPRMYLPGIRADDFEKIEGRFLAKGVASGQPLTMDLF